MSFLVEKMRIIPYDAKGKKPKGKPYNVVVNPTDYSIKSKIEYDEQQSPGTSSTTLNYSKTVPDDLNFKFLFDSTGSLGVLTLNPLKGIMTQLEAFKKVVFDYDGDEHQPNLVSIIWGTLKFKGKLTKLDINYKLFDFRGIPIRAEVETTFKGSIEDKLRQAIEKKSSPDLTHERIVNEGDNLPLMCHRLYGDSKYYLEVAKFNQIKHFRDIRPGDKLYFPPLEK